MIRTWEVQGIESGKIVSRAIRSTSISGAVRRAQFGRDPLRNVHGARLLETLEQMDRSRKNAAAAYKRNREMFP